MSLPKRNEIQIIEHKNIRVLTTKQLAEAYNADVSTIQYNFRYNKKRYIEGKHYIEIKGDELKEMKSRSEFHLSLKQVKCLYLWTEKGALLHAKSLNTDKAWEVYDYLVDFYFRAKEAPLPASQKQDIVPVTHTFEPLPDVTLTNPIGTLEVLLSFAHEKNFNVRSQAFRANYSRLHNNRIGIAKNLTVESVCYELAYELSHAMLHPGIDTTKSPYAEECNQRARHAALMLLSVIEHSAK